MNKAKLFFLFFMFQLLSFGQEEPKEISQIPVVKENVKEDSELTFVELEAPPIYPGCENTPIAEQRECFNTKLGEHVVRHFRYPKEALNNNIQGRVLVQFIIDQEGRVEKIVTRGPHPLLENEAFRIINRLPKMTPGKQKGKPVKVKYAIPITFRI
ncbi:energy transducer TonB [Flavobacterium cyclinae]|uniref:energy transducer TonB n=1 Tax=Flavobacterium cyclinae TaxID=2895947 RepID=UPI001E639553|nr:energy transducer TonB [Flavobacterium cyclinae]UGS20784.1 energy transducer TonB [Flavobacterium cyclinae]